MSEAPKLVEQLMKSPFKFYLGGSRRMNELHPHDVPIKDHKTDYDLYATYMPELVTWLTAKPHDFLVSHDAHVSGYPLDTEAVKILIPEDVGGIQVVLRKDAEFYRSVFEAIPVKFYRTHIWKSSPVYEGSGVDDIMAIFDAFFAIAHARGTATISEYTAPIVRNPIKAYEVAMRGII